MKQIKAINNPVFFYCDKQIRRIKDTIGCRSVSPWLRIHANDDALTLMEIKKREICVYKDAYPKATCSDIAVHIAKEWDVTVGQTTVDDILRSKEKWMSHERCGRAAKYGKLEEALMLWFN